MFIDEVSVYFKAGDGGSGCVSFRREKFVPKGGPNGGDGGRGGDLVLECDVNVGDLTAFKFKPEHRARNGEPGRGRDQHGHAGEDLVLKVPAGTIVTADETGEVVAELVAEGDRKVLLAGGKGGWGNARYKSSVNRAPRQFTPGLPGGEGRFRLVLKTIADIGLVGYPNAGKSSFTGMVTRAHPKTGAYPFTTLIPNVGVIKYPDQFDRRTLADIPGLVEGAADNRGLGHRFLRHIERCRLLLLLVDMAGTDGREPADDYQHLLEELGRYDPALLEKPRLVAANKMDEPAAEEYLRQFRAAHPAVAIQPISCLTEEGVPELLRRLYELTGSEPH